MIIEGFEIALYSSSERKYDCAMMWISISRIALWVMILFVTWVYSDETFQLNRDLFPEWHTKYKRGQDDRYIVLLIDHLGLANRLRSIADWFVVASLTKRRLVVSWRATYDCNAAFTDLFAQWPDGLELLTDPLPQYEAGLLWLTNAADARGLRYYLLQGHNDTQSHSFWVANNTIWARQDILYSPTIDAIFTDFLGLLTFDHIPCSIYKSLRGKFFRSLVPVPIVQSTVDSLYREIFEDQVVVGVHIRVHNQMYDWPMVAMAGATEAKRLGEDIPITHYASVMQRIFRHFGVPEHSEKVIEDQGESDVKQLPLKSRVRFYLISNDDDTKAQLLEYVPGGNVFFAKLHDYSRSSVEGIQCALIDFLLIARSQLIIQTYGSSFSLEAAAIGDIPLASITSEGIVYRDTRTHQYCGDPLLAKSHLLDDHTLPEAVVYEGTYDRRAVSVKFTMLYPCQDLQNWGLVDEDYQLRVYCYAHSTIGKPRRLPISMI